MDVLTDQKVNELRQNARSMVRELGLLNEAYFEIGVTLAERHLLIELASSPSLTGKEIAERLLLDKSTVSRLIARAEKKGYIQCTMDKTDKRKRDIQLTPKVQRKIKNRKLRRNQGAACQIGLQPYDFS
jgi:DNA-binding MarR family transcriptional regulator